MTPVDGSPPPPAPPPRVRPHLVRSIALIGSGVILAGMLLVVAISHQPGIEEAPRREPPPQVTELIAPRPLGDDPASLDDLMGTLSADAGWIQSVDEHTGQPDQRYRFARLHPSPEGYPEGWLEMEDPEAQLLISDRRVLHLSGENALASAPNGALERGTIRGEVLIRMYETAGDDAFASSDAEPLLTVRTDEADFDQQIGRIRCIGPVEVQTPTARLVGRGVEVQFNDLDRIVEHLHIAELDFVVLRAGADDETQDAPAVDEERPARTRAERDERRRDRGQAGRRARRSRTDDVFYVLELDGDVLVRQGAAGHRRTAAGDDLRVIFSPRSEGLQGFAALGGPGPTAAPSIGGASASAAVARRLALPALLVRLAQASRSDEPVATMPEPTDELTVITCTGSVTMTPLRDAALAPASPRDAELTMTGAPVRLDDEAAAASAICHELRFRTRGDRIDLRAGNGVPLEVVTPDLQATGRHFWLGRRRGAGGFQGDGRLLVPGDPQASPGGGLAGPPCPELRVAWTESMDLQFDRAAEPGDGLGRLRGAEFVGDVLVSNDRLRMDAGRMRVALADAPEETNGTDGDRLQGAVVESIAADDAVVRGAGRAGWMAAPQLELAFEVGADRRSTPRRMQATGGVEVVDETQHLWAQSLVATFGDRDAAGAPAAPRSVAIGASDIETLVASEDVQVLTADGARAFGDELTYDAITETGALRGADVLVVRDDLLLERGTLVEFDAAAGARWRGAGRARVLATATPAAGPERITRPEVPDEVPTTMRASWSTALSYDATVNGGAGAIELFGDVTAETRRTPLEHNTIEGQHVTVELTFAEEVSSADDAGAGRAVARFIARHQARLEARSWDAEDPRRKPDVFFVAGDYVEYDDVGGTALVVGEGTLLVRDLGPPADETTSAGGDAATAPPADETTSAGGTAADAAARPFGGRGTTMFVFGERLELTTLQPQRYQVVMTGGVQGSHEAADGRTAAVTGRRFEAIFDERPDAAARAGDPLGGSMDLRRLRGIGSVYIRTDERRVEADEFDYDLISGLATARALPGRNVSTQSRDGQQFSATAFEWDMATDRIRVDRTIGSANPDS